MPILAPQNFPATPWNFPAGTRRWYRLDVLVSEAGSAEIPVTLHAAFGSPTGVMVTQIAWRFQASAGAAFTYQFSGDLVVSVSNLGKLVSLFVELITPVGTAIGSDQSATVTIAGTSAVGSTAVQAHFVGVVGAPLDMRAAVSVVLDQTLGAASINQLVQAKLAANNLIDFMRADDWANVYYLPPNTEPVLPTATDTLKPMISSNKVRMHTVINAVPTSAVAPVRADLGLNVPAQALNLLNHTCACAPAKRAVILLSGMAAMGLVPVTAWPSVSRWAAWLGVAPTTPPTGFYTAVTISNPASQLGAFQLTKLLMQVLATSSGSNVLTDPQGTLTRGQSAEIAFDVSDADSDVRVIALTDRAELLNLDVHSEDGVIIPEQSRGAQRRKTGGFVALSIARSEIADAHPSSGCGCGAGNTVQSPKDDTLRAHSSGRWKAVLSVPSKPGGDESGTGEEEKDGLVSYSVIVVANSRVDFVASVNQDSDRIGATAFVSAHLEDSGVPISGDRARVAVEVTYPDGKTSTIRVPDVAEGQFEAAVTLTQPGTTAFRIIAAGTRLTQSRFQRELTFTTQTQGTTMNSMSNRYPPLDAIEVTEPAGQRAYLDPIHEAPNTITTPGQPTEVGDRRSLVERVLRAVAQEILR